MTDQHLLNRRLDAVVVGSGPNGLAAAIRLAQAGLQVTVYEAHGTIGGGVRSAALTRPGFVHDVCSAVHPMAAASPYFQTLPLERFGLHWVQPTVPLAHPLDDRSVLLHRSAADTAAELGVDRDRYLELTAPLLRGIRPLLTGVLGPLTRVPRHPLLLARFGLRALLPAAQLARKFTTPGAQALIAGLAGHAVLPLTTPGTSAIALILLVAAHEFGWPFPQGGAQSLTDALAGYFRSLGGEIVTGAPISRLTQLPRTRTVILDVGPGQLLTLGGGPLPARYEAALRRYRYGPGVFKIDYALSGPVPWRDPRVAQAGTVHLGGSLAEIRLAEAQVARGEHPERPYVLLAQHSAFDPTRAPAGQHTLWAYCHVPPGSSTDMTTQIEAQIERSAPGFRDLVIGRATRHAAAYQDYNPNYVGGDVNGGQATLWQMLARPVLSASPYRTPWPGVYLCSAATPPGGGVHGMCGLHAAEAALSDLGLKRTVHRKHGAPEFAGS
jgi:phytoene dehydrogenase-like protein